MITLPLILIFVGIGIADHTAPTLINFDLEARKLVHKSRWGSIGTIEVHPVCHECPTVALVSTADDVNGNIIFADVPMDIGARNLAANSTVTFMFTSEQDLSCSSNGIDPYSPRCPRVLLSGEAIKLNSADLGDGKPNHGDKIRFISAHPSAANWFEEIGPHSAFGGFQLYKMNIRAIRWIGVGTRGYASIDLGKYKAIESLSY